MIKHKLPSVKFRGISPEALAKLAGLATRSEFELDLTVKAYLHGQKVGLDIMHSYLDFMAHYISKIVKFPTIYSLHDPPYPGNTLDYWRLKHFPKDIYIPISISHRNSFGKLVRFTSVIYHGLNINSYKFHVHKGHSLVFMGRYLKEKGLVEAIETAKRLRIPLHIAGDKAYRRLAYYQKDIKPLLSRGHIQEIGFMDGSAKNEFLGKARAFLFPIKWEEPFGMVMLEAMACGTPVIAYNRGSVPEIVKDGVTGFIVNPPKTDLQDQSDKEWIIKKRGIEGLVEAVGRIGEIDRRACRKHVEENFTIDKMVAGYEKVYQKILSKI